ncbi:MAG: hypothetical protein HQK79_12300 [Desulfobacterales bacterium]|nr:hypothetical protein [Desulfobacterales bacterium]
MEEKTKKRVFESLSLIIVAFFFQSCVLLTGYALIQTLRDISTFLNNVNDSMNKIKGVIDEGKELKRAADEGRLLTTLAEKIPGYVRNHVEKPMREEIEKLSGDLKINSMELTKNLLGENVYGSVESYGKVVKSYNNIVDFVNNPLKKN